MTDDTIIHNDVELATMASDLLDTEAKQVFDVMMRVQQKFQHRSNSVKNLDMLRDEALTKLADIGILASVDASPCFYGEPPIVTIIGHVGGIKPLDHEQKQSQVKKATARGEQYLGQKEPANKPKKK